jgi:hypothetical protein
MFRASCAGNRGGTPSCAHSVIARKVMVVCSVASFRQRVTGKKHFSSPVLVLLLEMWLLNHGPSSGLVQAQEDWGHTTDL